MSQSAKNKRKSEQGGVRRKNHEERLILRVAQQLEAQAKELDRLRAIRDGRANLVE